MRYRPDSLIILLIIFFTDIFVWFSIFQGLPEKKDLVWFLDVGQGDAELVQINGWNILIDAGANRTILDQLSSRLPRKYLDLAIISHPQLDHFGGFREVFRSYSVGAWLSNGRGGEEALEEWKALEIAAGPTPHLSLGRGDRIRLGSSSLSVLSPSLGMAGSGELNDTSLVLLLETPNFRALFPGDIGFAAENSLKNQDVRAEILKVAHHGSKFASSPEFLERVKPVASIVEVGKGNSYGHPAPATLERLTRIGANVLRTDELGSILAEFRDGRLRISHEE